MGELLNALNNRSHDNLPSDTNVNLRNDNQDHLNVIIPKAESEVEFSLVEEVDNHVMENEEKMKTMQKR